MTDTFVGLPVTGGINHYSGRDKVEPWPPEKFKELLDAVFATGVTAVRWEQYTPYFNDGDVCEFHVYSMTARVNDERVAYEDEDEYGDYINYGGTAWADSWNLCDLVRKTHGSTTEPLPGLEDLYEALNTLDRSTNHFEDVLRTAFGDHCRVTATPEGFKVEEYDHD